MLFHVNKSCQKLSTSLLLAAGHLFADTFILGMGLLPSTYSRQWYESRVPWVLPEADVAFHDNLKISLMFASLLKQGVLALGLLQACGLRG